MQEVPQQADQGQLKANAPFFMGASISVYVHVRTSTHMYIFGIFYMHILGVYVLS